MYKRHQYYELKDRLEEERYKIQVITGPRQVGKSTMVNQVLEELSIPSMSISADGIAKDNHTWISQNWESARARLKLSEAKEFILVIDEIHKIDNWSESVKREWDFDSMHHINIKVVILGSSRLLIKEGLTESLAGRYELIRMGYWMYREMREAFDISLNEYVYFGGYPGSVKFYKNEMRWQRYIKDSIVDPVINLDILTTKILYKPELMRRLLELGCAYSGEEISLTKLLGQLQDAGNVTTLANYLSILSEVQILCGLRKYANDGARKYNSIPKMFVYNNALLSALNGSNFEQVFTNAKEWGRWVESAVGAFLLDKAEEQGFRIFYWRERNKEVDFVLEHKGRFVAIEVKSGNEFTTDGLAEFSEKFRPMRTLIVGNSAFPLEEFLNIDPLRLFD